ncbi:MDR/zinc-dependent alcohol dehydrogenase-like family protein [Chitinophaga japonensis]|uniref:Uncharacterized protein n=1 Tax=Chitinophaga japonensis TaxID=104662 RepID=A0A562SYA2_CHIJA|nr:hypothetical protein [Chitinophaga japonensis]TWI86291.1 hypothetical protein LX66_3545 [Chitinophaga japonensis]
MKKLFVTLSLICAFLPTWAQFTYHNAVPQWYDLLRVDKLLWINTSDTTGYPAVMYKGAVVFRQQPGDTAHYFSNGLRWLKIGSGATDLSGYYTKTESDARYPLLSGSYSNPSWITGLAWSKITGRPTTLAGYGITDAVPLSQKGTANGVATLDASSKVPLSQIPESLLGAVNYQGTYNASTNTPALPTAASGNKGWYYVVSVGGTQQSLNLQPGDWVISNGSSWGKVDNNNAVTSVFGRTGAVTAQSGDYTTSQVTEGSNLYFTNARARGALSAGTGISYNNTTGVITNSAPDQVVGLTAGTGISVTGTYPNFTVTNTGVTNTPNLQQVTDIGAITTNTIRAAAFQSTIDPGSAGYSLMNAGATLRWIVRGINAEGGSNSGYDISFNRRNDAGASIGDALTLIRSNGNAIFGAGVSIGSTSPDLSNSRFYLNADAGQIIRNPGGPSLSGGGRLRLMQSGLPDQADYPLGRILFDGDGNTSGVGFINPKPGAQIAAQADAAWTDLSSYPTRLSFYTNTGTTTTSETMRLSSIGWLAVGSEISSNYGIAAPFVVSYDDAQFDVSPTSSFVTFNTRNSTSGNTVPMILNASVFRLNAGNGTGGVGINKDAGANIALDVSGRTNSGGVSLGVRTITASTTTTVNDYTIISQATTGNPTITLTGGSGTIYVLVEEAANPTSNGMNWTPAITYKGATYSNANNAALSAYSRFMVQNVGGTWYLIGAD